MTIVRRSAVVIIVSTLLLFAAAPGTSAQEVSLGIKPVGHPGSFFALSLSPGEVANLKVELGNFGTEAIAARTFAADAYTIINGGFAAKLRGEPKTGPTLWTSYEEEVLELRPRQAVNRPFTVTVPPEVGPGEYIFGLVIENDQPVQGSGAVAMNQVNRQVIAVSITVPGPKTPKLEIGGAEHKVVAQRSVVSVGIKNSGNVLLKPSGELKVASSSDQDLFTDPVTMDSFYAFTDTSIEVSLPQRLEPGQYTATLRLADSERGIEVNSDPLPFEVTDDPAPGARPPTAVTELQDAVDGTPAYLLIGGGLLLVAVLSIGVLLGRRSRNN